MCMGTGKARFVECTKAEKKRPGHTKKALLHSTLCCHQVGQSSVLLLLSKRLDQTHNRMMKIRNSIQELKYVRILLILLILLILILLLLILLLILLLLLLYYHY